MNKTNKAVIFSFILLAGTAHAAPAGSTHVLGAKKQTLSSATDTVSAGYYAATMLHTVDTDLAPANIKSGTAIFGVTGTLAAGSNHELPDTGQTLCYNAGGGVITCPAHGEASEQDASDNPAATQPSYTDNLDFTITDNRTGLMWKKCSEGLNNDATCSGTIGSYAWAAALAQCGQTFAGHSDWRLPNVRELVSIVDYSISSTAAKINATNFPGTATYGYWSSTTYALLTENAWNVYYSGGTTSNSIKTSLYNVRCVRAGP